MRVVDVFAGGGGSSEGIRQALGREVDMAIDADAKVLSMHSVNHPGSRHIVSDVSAVEPAGIAGPGRIGLAWFSPPCTDHSRAKGGKRITPEQEKRRELAWTVERWAREARPDVIMLENVMEFRHWGPLVDGIPDKARMGETFRYWWEKLRAAGYDRIEMREVKAADLGVPTVRSRLIIIARRDGRPIVWPEATHGPGRALPWRTAAECIDWDVPCHSIFLTREEGRKVGVKRPLVPKTMDRIAMGLERYVLNNGSPFIAPVTHSGDPRRVHSVDDPLRTVTTAKRGEFALVMPRLAWMAQHNSGVTGHGCDEPFSTLTGKGSHQNLVLCHLDRQFGTETHGSLEEPAPTVVASGQGKTALVASFISHYHHSNTNGGNGSLRRPLNTVLANGQHKALVQGFLMKLYGKRGSADLFEPSPTAAGRSKLGIVTVDSVNYVLVDIAMRMLTPRELFRAQGFPEDYRIAFGANDEPITKEVQILACGNSVCPPLARALVEANRAGLEGV